MPPEDTGNKRWVAERGKACHRDSGKILAEWKFIAIHDVGPHSCIYICEWLRLCLRYLVMTSQFVFVDPETQRDRGTHRALQMAELMSKAAPLGSKSRDSLEFQFHANMVVALRCLRGHV